MFNKFVSCSTEKFRNFTVSFCPFRLNMLPPPHPLEVWPAPKATTPTIHESPLLDPENRLLPTKTSFAVTSGVALMSMAMLAQWMYNKNLDSSEAKVGIYFIT